jgi:hypothetical protein
MAILKFWPETGMHSSPLMAQHRNIMHSKLLSSFKLSLQSPRKEQSNLKHADACYKVSQVGQKLDLVANAEARCMLPI